MYYANDITMIKAPDIGREAFAKMSDDELNFRESVKYSIATKSEGVDADSGGKDLWSPSWAPLPQLFENGRR